MSQGMDAAEVFDPITNLCIKRRRGEVFHIGNCISVQIIDVKGDVVKVSIRAPKSVRVMRHEIRDMEKRKD